MPRKNFNVQFSSNLSPQEATDLIEQEFAPKLLHIRGYRALPRASQRLGYVRKQHLKDIAVKVGSGLVGGALESLGPLGEIAGWTTEAEGIGYSPSERIVFTITEHANGSTVNVAGRADSDARRLVDHVARALKAGDGHRTTCARCAVASDLIWCSSCAAHLLSRKIALGDEAPIARIAADYKLMWESGTASSFLQIFAIDAVARYPDDNRTMSRIELEAALVKSLPALAGCTMQLNEICADEDGTYWLVWDIQHPRWPKPRFVEHVRLNDGGLIQEIVVHR